MSFDREKFQAALLDLPNSDRLLQIPLQVFEIISSTNEKLWESIESGEALPLAALALQQTAGKGRWGRTWQSPPGGLYFSLALETQIEAVDSAHLTLFSAWGIATALRDCNVPVLLKWPNDLIVRGRKLGGIKIETRVRERRIERAVIGVGINWTNQVPETGINLSSIEGELPQSKIRSLEQLAAVVLNGIVYGHETYLSQGIDIILESYLKLLTNLGRSVVIEGSPGIISGVSTKGELQVRLHSPGATVEIFLQPGTISLGYDDF
jgi:BirA family biotin operon repressor/biotin-[acetyl-CoA-carboxylase] ligase